MKQLISLYREIRRSAGSSISPRQALTLADQLISIYDEDQNPNESDWGSELNEERQFIPLDMILDNQGYLLKQERFLLEEIYEDDQFYPKISSKSNRYQWGLA